MGGKKSGKPSPKNIQVKEPDVLRSYNNGLTNGQKRASIYILSALLDWENATQEIAVQFWHEVGSFSDKVLREEESLSEWGKKLKEEYGISILREVPKRVAKERYTKEDENIAFRDGTIEGEDWAFITFMAVLIQTWGADKEAMKRVWDRAVWERECVEEGYCGIGAKRKILKEEYGIAI